MVAAAFYDLEGTLVSTNLVHALYFFSKNQQAAVKSQICSVLAGYVWDESNPYVKNHDTALKRLARTIELTDMILKPEE